MLKFEENVCNTLQQVCNTLQQLRQLQHPAAHKKTRFLQRIHCNVQQTAENCNTLQHKLHQTSCESWAQCVLRAYQKLFKSLKKACYLNEANLFLSEEWAARGVDGVFAQNVCSFFL